MEQNQENKINFSETQSIRRCITVPLWLDKELKRRSSAEGFEFSDWCRNKYIEEFLSTEALSTEKEELMEKLRQIEIKQKVAESKQEYYRFNLSKKQTRWISSATMDIVEGDATREGCTQAYNAQFGTNLSVDEFKELMVYVSEQQKRNKNK